MLAKSFILILTSKIILAQINGEFWWLNNKLPYVKHVEPPKIEDNNQFDTDESAKIIFRDDDNNHEVNVNAIAFGNKERRKGEKWKIDAHFREVDRIVYPDEYKFIQDSKYSTASSIEDKEHERTNSNEKLEDEFKFYFPDDFLMRDKDTNNSNKILTSKKSIHLTNKDNMELTANNGDEASEDICSYMKKRECNQQNGLVHKEAHRSPSGQLICCILPLIKEDLSKIIFTGTFYNKRQKRSNQDNISPALKQRTILLKRRYGTPANKEKDPTTKIVAPDDDYNTDPYWNIKSTKLKLNAATNIKTDCYEDYVEDYVVELPKPGLLGVYSDHSRPGWPVNDNKGSSYGGNTYDDDYDGDVPGYSTIDPRRDTTTSKYPKRGKPSKLSSVTVTEENYDPESQTISYQSNPDFHVLQGFKLINLARNKNKFYSNSKKNIATESVIQDNSEESVFTESSSENLNKDFETSQQIYRNCGKVTGNYPPNNGKQLGSSENTSHPWLALVVLTKRRQFILCYATLVHPRAALTAGDCTHGRSSGEITLVAGLRDLKDRSNAQYRVTTTLLHPQYKPDELAHNLAVLHWNHALKLTANIQPACLGEPQANSDCFIYGWGGYDQAFRSRSRWQRATVLTSRQCKARISKNSQGLPSGAFCAEVQARGTVTGTGGSMVCVVEGRQTAVGVAVGRDTVLVLLPTHGWPAQALETILNN